MKIKITLTAVLLVFLVNSGFAQYDTHKVMSPSELGKHLTKDAKRALGNRFSELDLAEYLREQYSNNYFYDWQQFEKRFEMYREMYPEQAAYHEKRALDHLEKFEGSTQWKLPFNYKNGNPVNAYALRHLARQHKMVDIAFYHYYKNEGPEYIRYFADQQKSLNEALILGNYELIKDGNGVYEAFRSGYRVLNWLQIHAMFLSDAAYTDTDQLNTIATLLQHGAHLYENNQEFKYGNHQTRGLSALAMISIMLHNFEGTDVWYDHAMKLLQEHMEKEINSDGFQFERSIHYHMSDINNYFYVYRLAKINGYQIPEFYENKLKGLFTTLVKVAYPNKKAPVLQDDTDNPWAEYNDISAAMTLGVLVFDEPSLEYFADKKLDSKMYWYVTNEQLEQLKTIEGATPEIGSVSFDETKYYISRDGWEKDDAVMIISAGVDAFKPDHQHGDILGVQAMAYGKVMLPNYQVRYSLKDYGFFKNSMVKNVALVDDEVLGKKYTSNKGGSGFGKFLELPEPLVTFWETNEHIDAFAGEHNGFENVGVAYSRQVISIKNGFWIVKDNFKSEGKHHYKQVWQGHYSTEEGPGLIRATFDGGEGLDIYQINGADQVVLQGARGKRWAVIDSEKKGNHSFITVLFPYKGYENRLDEMQSEFDLKGWKINAAEVKVSSEASVISKAENKMVVFNTTQLKTETMELSFKNPSDVFVVKDESGISVLNTGLSTITVVEVNGKRELKSMVPGETIQFK